MPPHFIFEMRDVCKFLAEKYVRDASNTRPPSPPAPLPRAGEGSFLNGGTRSVGLADFPWRATLGGSLGLAVGFFMQRLFVVFCVFFLFLG